MLVFICSSAFVSESESRSRFRSFSLCFKSVVTFLVLSNILFCVAYSDFSSVSKEIFSRWAWSFFSCDKMVLASVRFCSISSYMSTYSGGSSLLLYSCGYELSSLSIELAFVGRICMFFSRDEIFPFSRSKHWSSYISERPVFSSLSELDLNYLNSASSSPPIFYLGFFLPNLLFKGLNLSLRSLGSFFLVEFLLYDLCLIFLKFWKRSLTGPLQF